MNRTLSISTDLYARLEKTAKRRGLKTVEQLLDVWQGVEEEMLRRSTAPPEAGREGLFSYYGEQAAPRPPEVME